jgi:hypothetical protein
MGLRALADFAWEYVRKSRGEQWEPPESVIWKSFRVPYVAKRLLLDAAPGTRYMGQPVTRQDTHYLLDRALDHSGYAFERLAKPTLQDFEAYAQRATLQQRHFQMVWRQEISRALYIYRDLLPRVAPELHADILLRCADLPDANMDMFFALTWVIFQGPQGHEFTRGDLARLLKATPITEEQIDAFLQSMSATPREYARRLRELPAAAPEVEFYEHNPLLERPLVEVHPRRYIAPSPDCLLYRLAHGPYYALYNRYCELEGRPDNSFSVGFGSVFEEYVCEEARTSAASLTVLEEFTYDGKRFADCSVVGSDEALLLECKTARVRLGAQIAGGGPDLEAFVEQCITKALRQLKRCICEARQGGTGRCVDGLRRYHPAIVIMQPFWFVNAGWVRDLVDPTAVPPAGCDTAAYQVLSISDLEDTVAMCPPVDLFSLLEEKSAPDRYGNSFGNFLWELRRRHRIRELRHAILAETWEALGDRFGSLMGLGHGGQD